MEVGYADYQENKKRGTYNEQLERFGKGNRQSS